MFLNLNAFGYDLELKFRKKEYPAPKVIVIENTDQWHAVSDICEALT